jgi:hypothetical protein
MAIAKKFSNLVDFGFFDRPIAYHRCIAAITGSVNSGVFLCQALYWSDRTNNPEGWFWKTAEEWTEETCLTRREQETCRKRLLQLGFIEEKRTGIPARMFYRLRKDQITTALWEWAHANRDRKAMHKNAKLECTKTPNWIGGNRQSNTESTAENTAETTEEHKNKNKTKSFKADLISAMWVDGE